MSNIIKTKRARMVEAAELVRAVRGTGSHFFDPDTMRFFNSRTASTGWHVEDGKGFDGGFWIIVTSEKFDEETPRLYSVRVFGVDRRGRRGSVWLEGDVLGLKFQEFKTGEKAHKRAREVADAMLGWVASGSVEIACRACREAGVLWVQDAPIEDDRAEQRCKRCGSPRMSALIR